MKFQLSQVNSSKCLSYYKSIHLFFTATLLKGDIFANNPDDYMVKTIIIIAIKKNITILS